MIKNSKGLFITLEGPDGSGKTSILKNLTTDLSKEFSTVKFWFTREPGGSNNIVAEDIRNILLNKYEYKITPRTEALLFAASRAQHVSDFIKPHLLDGDTVICDRYIHSSLAYQGSGREIGMDKIYEINRFAIDNIMPDLVIVLMIEPELGISRITNNSKRDFNRLDREKIDMHSLVYDGYLKMVRKYNDNFIVLDASKTYQEVYEEAHKIIKEKIISYYEITTEE